MSESSKIIRWGILGTAKIATKAGKAIHRASNAHLAGIASRSLECARDWAKEHEAERAFGTYEALLDDPEIDAVYIPLPPSLHGEWTVRAAEKGKHVLCEKPTEVNAAETVKMTEACRKCGVQFMDGVMWFHHDRTAAMRRALEEGKVGDLRVVFASFSFDVGPTPTKNIRLDAELGGGAIGDLGYYCVGACLWAFGDLPARVTAAGSFGHGVDMHVSGILHYDDGRTGMIDCAFDTAFRKDLEVVGNKAILRCEHFTLPVEENSCEFEVIGQPGDRSRYEFKDCIQEVRMIENFGRAIHSGTLNPDWPARAVDTMRVCDALRESADRNMEPVLVTS
jgi:predicted dehydrogenase